MWSILLELLPGRYLQWSYLLRLLKLQHTVSTAHSRSWNSIHFFRISSVSSHLWHHHCMCSLPSWASSFSFWQGAEHFPESEHFTNVSRYSEMCNNWLPTVLTYIHICQMFDMCCHIAAAWLIEHEFLHITTYYPFQSSMAILVSSVVSVCINPRQYLYVKSLCSIAAGATASNEVVWQVCQSLISNLSLALNSHRPLYQRCIILPL